MENRCTLLANGVGGRRGVAMKAMQPSVVRLLARLECCVILGMQWLRVRAVWSTATGTARRPEADERLWWCCDGTRTSSNCRGDTTLSAVNRCVSYVYQSEV